MTSLQLGVGSMTLVGVEAQKAFAGLSGSKDASSSATKSMFRNLRDLQRRILSVLASAGRAMYLREIAELLKVDKRRVLDSLKRLVKRGLVESFGDGRYRLKPDLRHSVLAYFASRKSGRVGRATHRSKDAHGTGVPGAGCGYGAGFGVGSRGGAGSVCLRLDNVRGFARVFDGYRYYAGDRFGDRDPSFLGYLDRVSYFEVSLKFEAPRNECFIAVYYRRREGSVVVEFRPYEGDVDVRRGDWRSVLRRGVLDMLRWALRVLKAAVRELGIGIFAEAAQVFREELGALMLALCSEFAAPRNAVLAVAGATKR